MLKSSRKKIILLAVFISFIFSVALAGEQGHYYPGVLGIRDLVMPPPGKYLVSYNPYYYSDDFKNKDGGSVGTITSTISRTETLRIHGRSIPVTITGNLTANVKLTSIFAAQQFLLIWVTKNKFLGADYGMTFAPSLGYLSVDAKADARGTGTVSIGDYSRTVTVQDTIESKNSIYGFGDFFFQPLWLGWHGNRHDISFNYGFYAPTGAYTKKRLANTGMGFWTQQFQLNTMNYLKENRATAIMTTTTYDVNSRKYDEDVVPGSSVTFEYAFSQYLSPRVETGICGYSQWQVSSDHGSSAKNKDVFYQTHGVGGQFSFWVKPKRFNLAGKCIYEYYAQDHSRGILSTLNGVLVF